MANISREPKNRFSFFSFFELGDGATQGDIPVCQKAPIVPVGNDFTPSVLGGFETRWTTTVANETITLPINSAATANIIVLWGDGQFSTYTDTSIPLTHTYDDAGSYVVTIGGSLDRFSFAEVFTSRLNFNGILQWGSQEWAPDNSLCFTGCTNMTLLPDQAIPGVQNITNLVQTFQQTKITLIPENLFDNFIVLTDMTSVFNGINSLVDSVLPANLFKANMASVLSMTGVFQGVNFSTVPAGFFDQLVNCTNFTDIFRSSSVVSIPDNLWTPTAATNLQAAFFQAGLFTICPSNAFNNGLITNLNFAFRSTALTALDPLWFAGLTASPVSFLNAFSSCNGLSSVPSNFLATTNLGLISGMFNSCANLTFIGSNIWGASNPNVQDVNNMFFGCSSLAAIPANVFSGLNLIEGAAGAFANCPSITSIPADLFNITPNIESVDSCFEGSGLTSIPATLFDAIPNCTSFDSTFAGTPITGIPSTLFNNVNAISSLTFMFQNCVSATGASGSFWLNPTGQGNYSLTAPDYDSGIPDGEGVYQGCTGLSDFASIPTHWK